MNLREEKKNWQGLRKIVNFIIIMIMVIGLFQDLTVYAEVNYNNDIEISVLTNSVTPLYNDANQIVAFYYELNNGGYIIVNADGSNFIEYSLEESMLDLDKHEKYYYNEPLSIYEKIDNSKVENCITSEITEVKDLEFNIKQSGKCNQKNATDLAVSLISSSTTSTFEEKKLSHETQAYDYNPDGRCGAVASAILLRYYNDYVNTEYITSTYETSDGKKLINYLVDNYLGKGTSYSKLKNGLNSYLSDRNISSRFQMLEGRNSITVFNKIRSYIKNNRPVIVGLTGSDTYGEHWVVGTGYSILYNQTLGYINIVIFNDGWGNKNVRLNLYYVDGCEYIS